MKTYSLPAGLRVYAIGDVHGYADALAAMHAAISADLLRSPPEAAHIVYLGDYIDRGPDSRGVIDALMARRDRGDGIAKTFLAGNHERAVFEFMADPLASDWLRYGGQTFLAGYGITFAGDVPLPAEKERAAAAMHTAIPAAHFDFLGALALRQEMGDFLFAHAGVDPRKPLERQSAQDLTAIREPFLSWHRHPAYEPLAKKVVHGHSVFSAPEHQPHRVSVDTGLCQGGPLSAAVIEGDQVRFLQVGGG